MVQFHQRIDASVPAGSVLFFGDRFIQGMCVTEIVTNGIKHGIGGDTTNGVLNRLPGCHSVARSKAVVLAVGDNDLRSDLDAPAIVTNYYKILSIIPADVPVLFCSLTPCSERGGHATN